MPGWNEIIGHKEIIQYMKQAVREGSPSHAYLLSGVDGVGKKMTAGVFAQALQCTAQEGEKPCGCCHSCIQALSGNHPDIITITHEKPNLISVDEIREQVVGDMEIKPYAGRFKIYLIEDADKMNPQAQNALLKTLEEPPAYGVIILMSTAPDSLLQTIRSRCVLLKMKELPGSRIREYLKEKLDVSEQEADICAAFARGSLGQAILLASSEEFTEQRKEIIEILTGIHRSDRREMLAQLKILAEKKDRLREYLTMMEAWFRDVLLYKAVEDPGQLVFKDENRAIAEQASLYSYAGIEAVLQSLLKAKDRLQANVSTELVLDLLLLTIKESI